MKLTLDEQIGLQTQLVEMYKQSIRQKMDIATLTKNNDILVNQLVDITLDNTHLKAKDKQYKIVNKSKDDTISILRNELFTLAQGATSEIKISKTV